jgi:hypothetical protein
MTKRFLTPIGLLSRGSDPIGIEGSIYYNSQDKSVKLFDGTTWNPVGTGPGGEDIVMVDGGNASSQYFSELDGGNA